MNQLRVPPNYEMREVATFQMGQIVYHKDVANFLLYFNGTMFSMWGKMRCKRNSGTFCEYVQPYLWKEFCHTGNSISSSIT
jgi:hypothetical protein